MEIIFLGTGAALPTKNRSGTTIAVNIGGETLLFDCGEGAQVQFQKAQLKPGKLARIFISHFHGDHFYGLIGLLTSLQLNGREKPLHLYGPRGLQPYLDFMQKLSQFTFKYEVVIHEFDENQPAALWDLGEYSVAAMPLDHRIFALGFRIAAKPKPGKFDAAKADELGIPAGPERACLQNGEAIVLADGRKIKPEQIVGPQQPGKKIAICLDTKPCANVLELARDVDLLIHDATFEDAKTGLAIETGHSTVVQAANVAKEAGAKQLLLTHISQRYHTDDEMLLAQAREIFPDTILGKDFLRLGL